MSTNQGLRQESFRAIANSLNDYNGDFIAAAAAEGITGDDFNGIFLRWLQARLGSTTTDLPALMQEYADSVGAYNWQSVGLIAPYLEGIQLWLDASDASTITQSSGSVSQWNDKSGNNRDVVQASASQQPTYNADGYIVLDGTDDELEVVDGTVASDQYSIFGVINNQTTNTDANVAWFSTSGGGNPDIWCTARSNAGIGTAVQLTTGNTSVLRAGSKNTNLLVGHYSGTTSNNIYVRVNGAQTTGSVNTEPNAQAATGLVIGRQKNTRNFGGNIHEVLMYNRKLTDTEVAQVEAYLANKWGVSI